MKPMCPFRDKGLKGDFSPAHGVMVRYMRIMKLHRYILDERLKETGVYRSQHQILMMLADHSNVSQKEIAERLYVSTATIAVSVKKLEKGGYITRVVDQEDNRMNKLCLTEKGKHTVKHSREFFHNVEERMFRDFSAEEMAAMGQFLDRVYDNLSHLPLEKDTKERED
ncbi:DNA-binding transcriptional regulator, MarR family [Lacrimispora sphenoides]|jgi:DNA-binding MarR family transcriptional regulator|uniref:MarR family winged helix-turn-helix transcriptional regulator n=1 Tax=Lacrimispora sphenoides TaxID=29370 RepID=UPI0008D0CACA|nr:MarR family transcriptional regulator [Lacrimispora sphenoides]SEU27018.1 DNA-binding transcriptional regulator, MarR family [Lacrimispora sphenoides]